MNKIVVQNWKKRICLLVMLTLLLSVEGVYAQRGGGGTGNGPAAMNNGRFYGKIVDENGKGLGSATVRLFGKQFDKDTKTMKEGLITGQLTKSNGDFDLEKVPIYGEFTLKVNYIGYGELEQQVTFGLERPKRPEEGAAPSGGGRPTGGGRPGGSWGGGAGGAQEKDLGNIRLTLTGVNLDEVSIETQANTVTLALDKKVYRVDQDIMAKGGNAEDALRNVPTLNVDLDGNLSLRNSSPQLFIDGRPTTLTLDQISADAIDNVEVITNPSAKYDAGGGSAGIVNIVLKKDRRIGYNGSIRGGIDSNGGPSFGGNLNAREGKINVFIDGFYNRRIGTSEGETDQQNLFGNPKTDVLQKNIDDSNGFFGSGRAGFDWFVDNRNTLTVNGSYRGGVFGSENEIDILRDSLFSTGTRGDRSIRSSDSERNFRMLGGAVLFKHLFPKEGAEWTADINYNRIRFDSDGIFNTQYVDQARVSDEEQTSAGSARIVTIQADFINPVSKKVKIEGGVRAQIRSNTSDNNNFVFNQVEGAWKPIENFADHFAYDNSVYAAYGQMSHQFEKWGYQVGLRAESSFYEGTLTDIDSSFSIDYPLSLFPSLFITRKLNELDNLQFAISRRINRPGFRQTSPFTDFSDSLNIQRGNPALLPQFSTQAEASYQKIFSKGHNLLLTAYYNQSKDLITRYQFSEFNQTLGREVIVTSYTNSNSSKAYGMELTMKNTLVKNVDLTSNLNVYNAILDAGNVEAGLETQQVSWYLKENLQIKLPAEFALQVSGQYRSKAAFTPASQSERRWGGGVTNTAQGFTRANWFVDIGLRKSLFKRKGSLSLGINDIFATRESGTFTESEFFIQDTWRIRNPQVVRLNFSYRFGKMDASLFKRKNTKRDSGGSDMM